MKKFKVLLCACFAVALAFALAGCAGNQQSQQEKQPEEQKTASVGDEIQVQTKYGDLNVTVEGFETDQATTEQYREYGDTWFDKDGTFCALTMTVENVSYENNDVTPADTLPLGNYVAALDDGAEMEPLNTGNAYGTYTNALNGYLNDFPTGKKAKVALTYCLTDVPSQITAKVGDTEVTMDVTAK